MNAQDNTINYIRGLIDSMNDFLWTVFYTLFIYLQILKFVIVSDCQSSKRFRSLEQTDDHQRIQGFGSARKLVSQVSERLKESDL